MDGASMVFEMGASTTSVVVFEAGVENYRCSVLVPFSLFPTSHVRVSGTFFTTEAGALNLRHGGARAGVNGTLIGSTTVGNNEFGTVEDVIANPGDTRYVSFTVTSLSTDTAYTHYHSLLVAPA